MNLNKTKERENAELFQKRMLNDGTWQSCLNCDCFVEGRCAYWQASPPPEVLVNGCDLWIQEIPF